MQTSENFVKSVQTTYAFVCEIIFRGFRQEAFV